MKPSIPSPQALSDRLDDLKQSAEKLKVKLTPEVDQFVLRQLEIIQNKIALNQPATPDDMAFMVHVEHWISRPDWWRTSHPSIDPKTIQREAEKRGISIDQWECLMDLSVAKGEEGIKWIERFFQFPGKGKIVAHNGLGLESSESIIELPSGLKVKMGHIDEWGLDSREDALASVEPLKIVGCVGLKNLPLDLEVEGGILLSDDLKPQVLEDAKQLEKERKIDHIRMKKAAEKRK